ncbi:hypothetical protein [Caulobacter sp.]|uniref:hypothetical protein n=1 Tax=Caulobacter sp. TaxID=78 RepID=UPI001B25FCA8|nr:hypothetical protein [Caulobacter sp.]MBO9545823.1 hypothetical protein [Caulobacter sp.]
MASPRRARRTKAARPRAALMAVILVGLDAAPVFALGDGARPGGGLPLCSRR